jgi:DNA (cytosine-5)-methyltransferase 1
MTVAVLAGERAERRPRSRGGESLPFAEFFAGIGLVRLGLGRAWRAVFANDIDEQKFEMYQQNFGKKHFALDDIYHLKASDIPDECLLYTASFPCNDLSIAGAWKGLSGQHSSTFWELIRLIEQKGSQKPPLVLLENVPGFLQSHGGKDFETAMLALNRLGYLCDSFILNATSWVPQSRPRLFVVAKQGEPAPMLWDVEESAIRPKALADFINRHGNINWDIRDLPSPPLPSSRLEDILEDLPDGDPHWWDAERAKYFLDQLSERHLAVANAMISGKRYSFGTAFRRVRHGRSMAELRTDGIAGCLRTPRGGSGRQILFKAGKGKYWVRLLTARECARLQGAPDSYKLDVPLNQSLFGFGDAVCVPAVRWIADNYLTPLARALRRSTKG